MKFVSFHKPSEKEIESSDAEKDSISEYERFFQSMNAGHRVDTCLRYIILFCMLGVVLWQIYYVHSLLDRQASLVPWMRLKESVLVSIVHMGIGVGGGLLLILGYWFGKDGGYQKDRQRLSDFWSRKKDS